MSSLKTFSQIFFLLSSLSFVNLYLLFSCIKLNTKRLCYFVPKDSINVWWGREQKKKKWFFTFNYKIGKNASLIFFFFFSVYWFIVEFFKIPCSYSLFTFSRFFSPSFWSLLVFLWINSFLFIRHVIYLDKEKNKESKRTSDHNLKNSSAYEFYIMFKDWRSLGTIHIFCQRLIKSYFMNFLFYNLFFLEFLITEWCLNQC